MRKIANPPIAPFSTHEEGVVKQVFSHSEWDFGYPLSTLNEFLLTGDWMTSFFNQLIIDYRSTVT